MWLNYNLGKVNLELMLPAILPTLRMIGGAPLEFTGADHLQLCTFAIVADQCLCLRFSSGNQEAQWDAELQSGALYSYRKGNEPYELIFLRKRQPRIKSYRSIIVFLVDFFMNGKLVSIFCT